jgi:hypothetical protein
MTVFKSNLTERRNDDSQDVISDSFYSGDVDGHTKLGPAGIADRGIRLQPC